MGYKFFEVNIGAVKPEFIFEAAECMKEGFFDAIVAENSGKILGKFETILGGTTELVSVIGWEELEGRKKAFESIKGNPDAIAHYKKMASYMIYKENYVGEAFDDSTAPHQFENKPTSLTTMQVKGHPWECASILKDTAEKLHAKMGINIPWSGLIVPTLAFSKPILLGFHQVDVETMKSSYPKAAEFMKNPAQWKEGKELHEKMNPMQQRMLKPLC